MSKTSFPRQPPTSQCCLASGYWAAVNWPSRRRVLLGFARVCPAIDPTRWLQSRRHCSGYFSPFFDLPHRCAARHSSRPCRCISRQTRSQTPKSTPRAHPLHRPHLPHPFPRLILEPPLEFEPLEFDPFSSFPANRAATGIKRGNICIRDHKHFFHPQAVLRTDMAVKEPQTFAILTRTGNHRRIRGFAIELN